MEIIKYVTTVLFWVKILLKNSNWLKIYFFFSQVLDHEVKQQKMENFIGKCRKLVLFYTNQSNFILPDHHVEMKFQAKSHVIET